MGVIFIEIFGFWYMLEDEENKLGVWLINKVIIGFEYWLLNVELGLDLVWFGI